MQLFVSYPEAISMSSFITSSNVCLLSGPDNAVRDKRLAVARRAGHSGVAGGLGYLFPSTSLWVQTDIVGIN